MKLRFEYIENQNINDIFGNLNKEANSLDEYIYQLSPLMLKVKRIHY